MEDTQDIQFPQLPITITLHRKSQPSLKADQTVTVRPGEKVREILAKTTFPTASLVSPETGFKIAPSDFLYRHTKHGDVIQVMED